MITILFLVLLFLHSLIHLPGFLKPFKLADFQQLNTEITKIQGIFWLLTSILFIMSGIVLIMHRDWWIYLAFAGVFLSIILILLSWNDAKFGMIPNIIILMAAIISLLEFRLDEMIEREKSEVLSGAKNIPATIIHESDISELPEPVKRWLNNCGIIGKPRIQSVRVQQIAWMKMKPEQKEWYEAKALQYVTTGKPAFIWTVKMKMSPFIKIKGRDKFVDGKGAMLIRMNSLINIVNQKGKKLNEGTLQRYLGELVWYPTMALSPTITWEAIDETSARAIMSYKGTSGSGIFHFNEQGDFVKFEAMRYIGNDSDAKRHEWVITVNEYATFQGIKVPSKMEATWRLEEGDWTWLKLSIVDMEYNL